MLCMQTAKEGNQFCPRNARLFSDKDDSSVAHDGTASTGVCNGTLLLGIYTGHVSSVCLGLHFVLVQMRLVTHSNCVSGVVMGVTFGIGVVPTCPPTCGVGMMGEGGAVGRAVAIVAAA